VSTPALNCSSRLFVCRRVLAALFAHRFTQDEPGDRCMQQYLDLDESDVKYFESLAEPRGIHCGNRCQVRSAQSCGGATDRHTGKAGSGGADATSVEFRRLAELRGDR
jgi:hypothetical protein